jgi:hypothetical protein
MMEKIKRIFIWPARFYQRYRTLFDRWVPAVVMVGLFLLTARATGTFSREWRLFIAGGLLLSGLAAPVAGYIVFILALAFPLYTISIYVAALALAVLIPLAFLVKDAQYLTAIVLVLSVPALVPYRIAPILPFLAGLWWAEWGGVLVGLGGALWLKIYAAMCDAPLDLAHVGAQSLNASRLISRFHTANSLQTLLWLVEPMTTSQETLLLHILEVLGWGLGGYCVGLVSRYMFNKSSRLSLGLVLSIVAGILGLAVGVLILPLAMGLRESLAILLPFVVEYSASGAIVAVLYGLSRYLNRPAVEPLHFRSKHIVSRRSSSGGVWSRDRKSGDDLHPSENEEGDEGHKAPPSSWESPQSHDDRSSDIIMIDLD